MQTDIRQINDERVWTKFLDEVKPATFTQSWPWKRYQESLGHETLALGWYERGEMIGVCLAIRINARRGHIFTIPHGPISRAGREHDSIKVFALFFVAQAQKYGSDWIRWAPFSLNTAETGELFKSLGYHNSPTHLHAECSWILDLGPGEDDLLRAMRKTTRHEIRNAERQGIKVKIGLNGGQWQAFESNYKETVRRQKYIAFPLSTIKKEIEAFGPDEAVTLGVAWKGDQPIASAVILFAHGSAFYHHGASATKFHHLPGAHALHWALIREAKRRGCHSYNFWGTTPKNSQLKRHPWRGLSIFKRGFGGRELKLLATQDFVIHPWKYWPVFFLESLVKRLKGL